MNMILKSNRNVCESVHLTLYTITVAVKFNLMCSNVYVG